MSNFKFQISTLTLVILLLGACSTKQETATNDTYTCPMHPTVISDKPGSCPVCGMDLVKKARPGEEVKITEDLARLIKSPNETVVASIRTIKAEYKSVPTEIKAEGIVTYDTKNIFTISSRVSGRLEKVYLKFEFQPVVKGQTIAEIYSPELITVQRELLFLLDNDASNATLIHATKNKLQLLGFTTSQLNDLISRKKIMQTFVIHSPYSGFVVDGHKAPSTSVTMPESASDRMNSGAVVQSVEDRVLPNAFLLEGNYVTVGQTLFTIANTNDLRIEIDLPSSQGSAIKKGNKLQLDFGTGATQQTAVDFVQPFFNEGEEFIKLRLVVAKSEDLHIGHLVKANLHMEPVTSLWIPKEAVVDLGNERIVFLKERGVFKPKAVVVGTTSQNLIEVKSGLASADEIAGNAQYLVDSEGFIKSVR